MGWLLKCLSTVTFDSFVVNLTVSPLFKLDLQKHYKTAPYQNLKYNHARHFLWKRVSLGYTSKPVPKHRIIYEKNKMAKI